MDVVLQSLILVLFTYCPFFCLNLFQVYYYHPFSALSDPAKLYNDLRWNITRPQGFEAVMRVRCSQVLLMATEDMFSCDAFAIASVLLYITSS